MFDTHCHLNFKALLPNVDKVIQRAKDAGVINIVVPGTDVGTSEKAVEIANKFENIYAAVGIHPHHVYQHIGHPEFSSGSDSKKQMLNQATVLSDNERIQHDIQQIENLLQSKKVVAIGEVGLDRHYYQNTRHKNYQVTDDFIELQKQFFLEQLKLAKKYHKSVIIHNREARSPSLRSGVSGRAKKDILIVLDEVWDKKFEGRSVFHCCEPDEELLLFAKEHNMYIGVDGDITYRKDKQEFIKKIPLSMLVLETDAPFLLPEPLRSQNKRPRSPSLRSGVSGRANEPKNIKLIAEFIAKLKSTTINQLIAATTKNAKKLFLKKC